MSITPKALKRLRDNFLDSEVIIYLRDMNVTTVNEDGQEITVSAMIQAYIVDIDADFLYLGLPDGTITRVIQHDIAPMIELLITTDLMMEDYPENDEEVH